MFASVFLLSRGFTNTQVGVTLAVSSLMTILCQPFVAAFADKTAKIPLRVIIAAGMGFSLLSTLVLMVMPEILIVTALLFILLIGSHALQQSLITGLAMDHINRGQPVNFSLARGSGSFVFAIVSIVIGFLVDGFGGSIVLPVFAGICVICIFVILRFPKPQGQLNAVKPLEESASSFMDFLRDNRRFMAAIVAVVLLLFSHILINTYIIRIIESVGGSSADMGIAAAVAGFVELPAMLVFPFLLRKLKSAGLILKLSAVFVVVKTLLTIFAGSVSMFYFAQLFQFFAFAMYIPASVYYVNRIVKAADRVKGQSYMGLALSVSGMLGNVAGGVMIDILGLSTTLWIGLFVSVTGLIAFLFIAPKDKEEV